MKRSILSIVIMSMVFTSGSVLGAGLGDLFNRGKKIAEEELKKKAKGEKPEEKKTEEKKPEEAAKKDIGTVVFSRKPIDPAKPEKLVTKFKAGDHIYGLIKLKKTWRETYKAKGRSKVAFMLRLLVDGKVIDYQYVELRKPELMDAKTLAIEIAPDPDTMKSYQDPKITFGRGKGNRKIGPDAFTYTLGGLKGGAHKIGILIKHYSDIYAQGDFDIEGEDYLFYKKLREKVLAVDFRNTKLPAAKKVDKEMAATMKKLLENAGWKNILKINIVDKDWWLDRKEGGDSEIISKHIAAAVAAKAEDGSCYYCICTFHRHKQPTGEFDKLKLTHTSEKKKILEQNIR